MKLLCDRILHDGHVFPGNVLKVDIFLNHQIDPALLRGKRFSKKIEVPLPDSASREEIFERTLRRYGVAATPHAREVFLESADGKSAADIVCDVENAVFKFKRHDTPLEETFRKIADARTGVRRLGFVSGR